MCFIVYDIWIIEKGFVRYHVSKACKDMSPLVLDFPKSSWRATGYPTCNDRIFSEKLVIRDIGTYLNAVLYT